MCAALHSSNTQGVEFSQSLFDSTNGWIHFEWSLVRLIQSWHWLDSYRGGTDEIYSEWALARLIQSSHWSDSLREALGLTH